MVVSGDAELNTKAIASLRFDCPFLGVMRLEGHLGILFSLSAGCGEEQT